MADWGGFESTQEVPVTTAKKPNNSDLSMVLSCCENKRRFQFLNFGPFCTKLKSGQVEASRSGSDFRFQVSN